MHSPDEEKHVRSRAWLIVYALLLNSLGSIIGYEFGMLNTFFKPFIEHVHGITDLDRKIEIASNLNFLIMVGLFLNSCVGSQLIARFGRYRVLVATAAGNCLSFLLLLVPSIFLMHVARFVGGFCGGFCFNLPPLIYKELFPRRTAQTMASLFHIFHTVGTMIPYAFGTAFWAERWRVVFALPLAVELPKLVLLLTLFNVDTPKWLFFNARNREEEILRVYRVMYREEYAVPKAEEFLRQMAGSLTQATGEVTLTHLFGPRHIKAFLLAILLCIANQAGGICFLVFYSRSILEGLGFANATTITFFMGGMNVLGGVYITLFANRFSRRATLLRGMILQCAALFMVIAGILLRLGLLVVLGMYLFVFAWGLSLGGMLIPYLADIVPQAGISYAGSFRWAINCLNAKLGLYMMLAFGALNMFTAFLAFLAISTLIFVRAGIETSEPRTAQKEQLIPMRHSVK